MMADLLRAHIRLSIVWILLLAATGAVAWLTDIEYGHRWATTVILLTAAIKIGMIFSDFMELRTAPRPWRMAFGTWLLVVTGIVVTGFWMS